MVRNKVAIWIGVLVIVVYAGSLAFAKTTQESQAGISSADQKNLAALQNDKADARAEAARKLGESRCKEAVDPLIQLMQNDKEYRVRIVAGMALLQIGDTRAMEAIKEQSMSDKNKTVRAALAGVAKEMVKLDLAER